MRWILNFLLSDLATAKSSFIKIMRLTGTLLFICVTTVPLDVYVFIRIFSPLSHVRIYL